MLSRREPDVRRVLQAVVTERLEFAPFDDGEVRGYQFSGTGSYGDELLGDTSHQQWWPQRETPVGLFPYS